MKCVAAVGGLLAFKKKTSRPRALPRSSCCQTSVGAEAGPSLKRRKGLTKAVLTVRKLHGMNSSVDSVRTHQCPVRGGQMQRMQEAEMGKRETDDQQWKTETGGTVIFNFWGFLGCKATLSLIGIAPSGSPAAAQLEHWTHLIEHVHTLRHEGCLDVLQIFSVFYTCLPVTMCYFPDNYEHKSVFFSQPNK